MCLEGTWVVLSILFCLRGTNDLHGELRVGLNYIIILVTYFFNLTPI